MKIESLGTLVLLKYYGGNDGYRHLDTFDITSKLYKTYFTDGYTATDRAREEFDVISPPLDIFLELLK